MDDPLDLGDVVVPQLTVGSVCAPQRWTCDVQTHMVPLSVPSRENLDGPARDELDVCVNVARFEALHRNADTIYITEVFVPHGSGSTTPGDNCSAQRQQSALMAVLPRRADCPMVVALVAELTRHPAEESLAPSVAALLCPTHRIFVQVVVDAPRSSPDIIAKRILDDTVSRYYAPICRDGWATGPSSYFFREAMLSEKTGAVVHLRRTLLDGPSPAAVRWHLHHGESHSACQTLRQLLWHDLQLTHEDLFAIPSGGAAGSVLQMAAVGLAGVPLTPETFSLFNYRSVERTFEDHIADALAEGRKPTTCAGGYVLTSLPSPTRFILSEAFLQSVEGDAAAAELEAGQTAGDGTVVPQRLSHYALTPKSDCGCDEADPHPPWMYILELHAPYAHRSTALVLAAAYPAPPHGADLQAYASAAVQHMRRHLVVEYPRIGAWSTLGQAAAGYLLRQGRLILRLPAGDLRYSAVVYPTAGAAFSHLGSLTVSASPRGLTGEGVVSASLPHSLDSSQDRIPTASPALRVVPAAPSSFDSLNGVWSLLSDGRDPHDYLSYIISEYQYDLQVKNLSNVGQRTTAEAESEVLQVRQCVRQGVGTARTRVKAQLTPLFEESSCSAWLDVGRSQRHYIWVRSSGVGRLLVCQVILEGGPVAAAAKVEEAEVERWLQGVAVGTIP